jgi:TonB-linked SusC/RagA family outer membrane protein
MKSRTARLSWLVLAASVAAASARPIHAQANTGSVTGVITDAATGAPVSGASVLIAGSASFAVSNDRGEYSIFNVRAGTVHLSAQRIGYQQRRDSVQVGSGARAQLNFALKATVSTLSEVVVSGVTGNAQRRAQAAVVGSIDVANMARSAPVSTVNEILQSRLPGVSVNATSGTAGSARSIRIRGASSIALNNQPLMFIDGIRVSEEQNTPGVGGQRVDRLNDLNPDDIESIEVLKGPAAATLYGADASAGVIQIITKKGKIGSNSFTQTLRFDVAQIDQNWTPPDNFARCTAAQIASTSTNPLCRGKVEGTLVRDNPLVRVGAFQQGSERNLGWTGRGGGSNYGYFLSATSDATVGTLPNNGFQRTGFRGNANFVPDSRVRIDMGINVLQSNTDLPDNDNNTYGWLGGGLLGDPGTRSDAGTPSNDGFFGFARQYEAIKSIRNRVESRRSQVNLATTYQPNGWLTHRFTVGADLARDELTRFFPKNSVGQYAGNLNTGDNTQTRLGVDRFTIDYLTTAQRTLGADAQWGVNLSAGLQSIITRNDNTFANGFGFVTNSANSINNASTRTGGQQFNEQKALGYLGELQLSSRNRRFLQLGARVDQNSSFGEGTPSFFLPKVGASWVLSEESFFAPLDGFISQLRLRAAWGTTGRSPAPGASLTTFVAAPFAITGVAQAGAVPNNPGNDSLRAERGTEVEAGFDLSTWGDRVGVEFTYFDKSTKDLLLAVPLPPSLGFQANPFRNIGEIRNRGIELGLTASLVRHRHLGWDVRAGFNTLDNRLVSLGGVAPFSIGNNRFIEGQPLGGYASKRIRSIDEATGVVTVGNNLEIVGPVLPTREWNIANTFTIRRDLRLALLVDSKTGHLVFNGTDQFRETQLVRSANRLDTTILSRRERLRRYGNPTPGAPAFVQEDRTTTTVNQVLEAYMQPGDFVRLREVSLSWSLPRGIATKLGPLTGGTFTVAAQNLALWTRYEGPDPEVVSNLANQFDRQDFLTLPNPRRIVLKTNFSF